MCPDVHVYAVAEGVEFEPTRSKLLAVFKRECGSTFGGVASADQFVLVRLQVLLAAVVAVSCGRRDL
jgi:hypothetical protein